MPTRIVYGSASFKSVEKYLENRKILIVTSQGTLNRGVLESVISGENHIQNIIANIPSHPDLEDLKLSYELIEHNKIDLILAVGGGSVLDAAKFFSVYQVGKGVETVENILKGKSKDNYQRIPILSVPTTAGTGSEITPWATIWERQSKQKYSLHLPDLFSETAIYDPELTLSVPKQLTIQTGLDTLSHALESIWNKNASQITVDYAVKSIQLIIEFLPKLINDLNNIEYRDNIMKACMYAGLAFSNTQTAIAHAMSYYITMHKGIDHGIACSFTLPMIVDEAIGQYEFVDTALKGAFGELSSRPLRHFMNNLEVSTEFEDYDISKWDLEQILNSLKNNQRSGNSLIDIKLLPE